MRVQALTAVRGRAEAWVRGTSGWRVEPLAGLFDRVQRAARLFLANRDVDELSRTLEVKLD